MSIMRPTRSSTAPLRAGAGHLNLHYEKDLEPLGEESAPEVDAVAFMDVPICGDSLAEELGEDMFGTATSGQEASEHLSEQLSGEATGAEPVAHSRAGTR